MPPAARISDMHTCPKVEPGPVPHVGGPTSSGEATVIIGGMPAARIGDSLVCFGGPPDSISQGEFTVIIGGKPAARMFDGTSHGGLLVAGCPTVIIGSSAQAQTLSVAARDGTPFCEECEKKKRAWEAAQAAEAQKASAPAPAASMPSSSAGPSAALSAIAGGGSHLVSNIVGGAVSSALGAAGVNAPVSGVVSAALSAALEAKPVKACTHSELQRTPALGSETRTPEKLAKSLEDEAKRLDQLAAQKQVLAMGEKDPQQRQALLRSAESTRDGAQDKRFEAWVARDTNAREVSVQVSCVGCGETLAEFDVVTGNGTYKEVKASGKAVKVQQLYKEMELAKNPVIAPPGTVVHLAVPGDGRQRAEARKRFVRPGGRKMTNKGAGYDRLIQEH